MFHNRGSIIAQYTYVIYIENDLVRLWIPAGHCPWTPSRWRCASLASLTPLAIIIHNYFPPLRLGWLQPCWPFIKDSHSWWETNIHRWSPVSFCYTVSLNVDWTGPTVKHTIWKFEWSPRTCLGPKAVFACPWNLLYPHSARRRMERNWGSHQWNASLHAADSLMMIVSLGKPLSWTHPPWMPWMKCQL